MFHYDFAFAIQIANHKLAWYDALVAARYAAQPKDPAPAPVEEPEEKKSRPHDQST